LKAGKKGGGRRTESKGEGGKKSREGKGEDDGGRREGGLTTSLEM